MKGSADSDGFSVHVGVLGRGGVSPAVGAPAGALGVPEVLFVANGVAGLSRSLNYLHPQASRFGVWLRTTTIAISTAQHHPGIQESGFSYRR